MTKSLQSALGLIDGRTVAGFVRDPAAPERRFVVEILADDVTIALVLADAFSPALATTETDDANHGFCHTLTDRLAATAGIVSARLANLATPVGKPIDLAALPKHDLMLAAAGAVEVIDGRVITGWVKAAPKSAMLLRATSAGEEVAATIARTWTSHVIGGEARPVLAFKLQLPESMLDGRLHNVEITTPTGVALAGSPVQFNGRRSARPKP